MRPVIAITLCAAAALGGCGNDRVVPPSLPRPIAWATVAPAATGTTRTLTGVVRASTRAALSFEVSGRIDEIAVDIGSRFAAGDLLARLDARTFELALAERESALAEAEAEAAEAMSEFERQRALHRDGWASGARYDRAVAALETAKSRVQRLGAALEIAREDLADTKLVAPYDGAVARRRAEPSQQIAAGTPVLDIQGVEGGLEVVVSTPETLIDRLAVGAPARVTLPALGGGALAGVIAEIGAEATAGNAFPVTVTLPESPATVRAGMTAEVGVTLDSAPDSGPLVEIPVTALRAGHGPTDQVAFVYHPDSGTVRRRTIEIADLASDRALVADGLTPGEVVATAGLAFLSDGQAVSLLGHGPARYNP